MPVNIKKLAIKYKKLSDQQIIYSKLIKRNKTNSPTAALLYSLLDRKKSQNFTFLPEIIHLM